MVIRHLKFLLVLICCFTLLNSYALTDKIDGLNFSINKLIDENLDKYINKHYDLYELYFENKSSKTFSIPGYSISFGIPYDNPNELSSEVKSHLSKRLAILQITATAVSLPFGSIATRATNTAVGSIKTFKGNKQKLNNEDNFLSSTRRYILYPDDHISLFFLINKDLETIPGFIKFVCHDEEENLSKVLIQDEINIHNIFQEKQINAQTESDQYD